MNFSQLLKYTYILLVNFHFYIYVKQCIYVTLCNTLHTVLTYSVLYIYKLHYLFKLYNTYNKSYFKIYLEFICILANYFATKQPHFTKSIRTLQLSKPRVRHQVPPFPEVWLLQVEGYGCSMPILFKPLLYMVHFLSLHHLCSKYDSRNTTGQGFKHDIQ